MAHFPSTFNEAVGIMRPPEGWLGKRGDEALGQLTEQGYVVLPGLSRHFSRQVSITARQEHITNYCWKDPTSKRFADEISTEEWLKKNGGRGMFILARNLGDQGLRLAGYGWEGVEQSDQIPSGETTFALRIGKYDLRRGLALPFTEVIVAGAARMYDAQDVWLETWGSNTKAVSTYEKAGFEEVTREPGMRQISPNPNVPKIPDIRVYMSLPNDILPAAA